MVAGNLFKDDKVVQVPVQYSRQLQLRQLGNVQPQRAAAKVKRSCVMHELLQSSAFERHGEATAQFGQVNMQAVVRADHGQGS